MSDTKILTLPGLRKYDGKIKEKLKNITDVLKTKLDKNQGVNNSGKLVGINESGDIVPMFASGLTYNKEEQLLEFGADESLHLNKGIQLDETLSKSGYAADAVSVGKLKSELTKKYEKPLDGISKADLSLDVQNQLHTIELKTQAEYDSIVVPDPNTIYLIVEEQP